MKKDTRTNNDLQSTTQKAKDRTTGTTQGTGANSCFISDTHRVIVK